MKHAFSLIELLVVIAIVALLVALTIPAITSIGRSTSLSGAAQSAAGMLDLARQTATSQNRMVEVRLYKLPEEGQPSATPSDYRAMQFFMVDYDSTTAMTEVFRFSVPAVISNNATASSLMDNNSLPEQSGTMTGVKLPAVGSNYIYRSFRFKPDGTLSLDLSKIWTLSVVNKNDPLKANGLPANYATISIEPLTGKVKIDRP